jgi:TonB family protein
MARHHTSAPNGPETFQQLKALLGRLPTVDELSRELDPAPGRRQSGRRFMVAGAICLPLLAVGLFFGRPSSPELPAMPAVETAADLPVLPAIEPPPLPATDDVPIRKATVPAQEKTRGTARRRTLATTAPRLAPGPPPSTPVEVAPGIQQRVLPDVSASARRTIKGRIRIHVRVSVDPAGNVTAASSDSPDASKYFNGLAVKAAREWKFAPVPDQDATRERMLRFEFARQDTTATVVP